MRSILTILFTLLTSALMASNPLEKHFSNLPEGMEPETVAERISEQFLTANPRKYAPQGYDWEKPHGWRKGLTYAVVSLWVNALEFADKTGREDLERRLVDHYRPKSDKLYRSGDNHVDQSVFGALPLEIYLLTGCKDCHDLGMRYADHQWEAPDPKHPGATGNYPYEGQLEWLAKGYTPQTRLWIDDMYMINFLQTQAFRVTGDMKYITRCSYEMALYLDELQNEDGLFYHSEKAKFDWGRGNGWMAAGMPLLLKYLPETDPYYGKIMKGYRKMMKTLLKHQRKSGLWGQLVTDPESWDETSGSAMFTYAFVEGIRNGWLPAKYAKAARRAWVGLCGKLDKHANVADVCLGTDQLDDRDYYLARPRVNGDPHGQAPMLWIVNALL